MSSHSASCMPKQEGGLISLHWFSVPLGAGKWWSYLALPCPSSLLLSGHVNPSLSPFGPLSRSMRCWPPEHHLTGGQMAALAVSLHFWGVGISSLLPLPHSLKFGSISIKFLLHFLQHFHGITEEGDGGPVSAVCHFTEICSWDHFCTEWLRRTAVHTDGGLRRNRFIHQRLGTATHWRMTGRVQITGC